jgi:hypothetical protein
MIPKVERWRVHIPSLLKKVGNEVDQWWFGQTMSSTGLLQITYLVPYHISVVDVSDTLAGDLNCVHQQAKEISPTLVLVPGVIIQRKKMETKGRHL